MNVSQPATSSGRIVYTHRGARVSRLTAQVHDTPAKIPLWKHTLDIFFILSTAPVWLPIMILITLWIKWVSSGPVFFRQERVGLHGKPFMIFKFRSMVENAETCCHEHHVKQLIASDRPMTKLDKMDDRIIRGGRFLRATGLDELPQLFNVLWGDMSLVGPRPCLPTEFERYNSHQRERVKVPPGLTGYWQVNGKNKTTFCQMIELDIYYTKHISARLDFEIMLRTFPALVAQFLEARSGGAKPKTSDLGLEKGAAVTALGSQKLQASEGQGTKGRA